MRASAHTARRGELTLGGFARRCADSILLSMRVSSGVAGPSRSAPSLPGSFGRVVPGTLADDSGIADAADEVSFAALCAACLRSGGVACEHALAARLRRAHEARSLHRLITSREVLAFGFRGTRWVPMAQFKGMPPTLRPQFMQVWSELAGDLDGWGVAAWFARRNRRLSGSRPIDVFAIDLPAVLHAAREARFVCTA